MKNSKPFIPLELPFTDLIDESAFINDIVKASESLATFNFQMQSIKTNDVFLLHHLLRRESYYSTKIEGTTTTFDKIYEAELRGSFSNDNNLMEVMAYAEAIYYAEQKIKEIPISTRLFREIHKILLSPNARGTVSGAGEYRTVQNFVGEHTPPEPQLVNMYMSNLEKYINQELNDGLQPLVKAAIIHAQFETIHPFIDGNGRMGRVLIPLFLYQIGKINNPYFFMSKALEQDRYKYYTFLHNTRKNTKEAYTEWIVFFLQAVTKQTESDTRFIKDVNKLYENTIKKIKTISRSNGMMDIIAEVFRQVIFDVNSISEKTNIPTTTIRYNLGILKKNKFIYSDNKKRNKSYYFYDLLNLIKQRSE